MADRPKIGLDNPAFYGRLRQPRPVLRTVRPVTPRRDLTNDTAALVSPQLQPKPTTPQPVAPLIVQPQPFASSAVNRQQRSQVLRREQLVRPAISLSVESAPPVVPTGLTEHPKLYAGLITMALVVFITGLGVSLQTALTNHSATAQVAALAAHSQAAAATTDATSQTAAPSTVQPSAQSIRQYAVAADLPRYLKIPKLGVNARVLQVGVKNNGELATPSNVFDTAWYTGSAKPGQPGATLIDGHVSSWTSHGVFYGIKRLVTGDTIQIQRGDGVVLNYRVVKTQTYSDDTVDMQAAVSPIIKNKPGLNLITCTGKVKPGTNEFNQRLIVFTEQV